MKFRVYKSLDRSTQIFGIRGRYLFIMAVGAAISIMLGIAAGSITSGLVGLLCALVLGFSCAMGILILQAYLSEKELSIKISMMRCPDGIRVKPVKLFRK